MTSGGEVDPSASVHPSVVCDPGASIGPRTRVWHFVHVASGASIGADCVVGQGCYIAPTARVGDRSRLQNNVSVYDGVTLEEDVFCGPSVVFTNVTRPRAFVSRRHAFVSTLVRKGASLGANATIVCGTTIGRYALVGAGAVVTRDVLDFEQVVGVPARRVGWVCRCGHGLASGASPSCGECGSQYEERGGVLAEVPS